MSYASGVLFRPAVEPQSSAIAELLSSGFSPLVQPILLYKCRGAAEYIRCQIASCDRADSAFFVAQESEIVVAAVELRRRPNGLFLNYIGVKDDYRKKRIATALLKTAVQFLSNGSGRITLDVIEDNTPALNWYTGLGFEQRSVSEMVELAPPNDALPIPVWLSGAPQAALSQARFGFSLLTLITSAGEFNLGRVGESWFRLTDPTAAADARVLAALKTLDRGRRIFAVVPEDSGRPSLITQRMARIRRMEMEIGPMLATLENRDHQRP